MIEPIALSARWANVCTENLSSGVVVVKSAQNGACTDHTGSLNRARNRRILVQGSMRSDAIVIVGVGFQDPTQMHLAQDNDVVHTLTADRSDQPFGKAILPRRGWRGRLVPDAHGAKSACDNAPIDPIPIADEVVRSLIPGKGLWYLTCNPFCRRICCDVDPDEVSAIQPHDDEGIKQVETDRWNHEQVHGGNVRRVVAQEGSPSLAGRPRRLTMYLATLDCAISSPSLSSSPWMRGAPQSGFSTLIRRINTRMSVSICGRPPRGRDFQRQ